MKIILLFLFTSLTAFGQDTIRRIYRPWLSDRAYTRSAKAQKNNSFVKVADLRGNIRFVGQVYGDCGSYNGETREYFSNNRIKKMKRYSPGVANGCPVKNGSWIYYDKSGNVRKKILYENGVKKNVSEE